MKRQFLWAVCDSGVLWEQPPSRWRYHGYSLVLFRTKSSVTKVSKVLTVCFQSRLSFSRMALSIISPSHQLACAAVPFRLLFTHFLGNRDQAALISGSLVIYVSPWVSVFSEQPTAFIDTLQILLTYDYLGLCTN